MAEYVTMHEMVQEALESLSETDPDKILAYEILQAESRVFYAKRKLNAEPNESIRHEQLRFAERELSTLLRVARGLQRGVA